MRLMVVANDEFIGSCAGDCPIVVQSRFLGAGLRATPVERGLGGAACWAKRLAVSNASSDKLAILGDDLSLCDERQSRRSG
jgi:hypothetical protein